MTETKSTAAGAVDSSPIDDVDDVFAAARWFESLWNSGAKAASYDQIEWQCCTWGSGQGGGEWLDTAVFLVVAARFAFRSWASGEREELVIAVPLVTTLQDRAGQVAEVVNSWEVDPSLQFDDSAPRRFNQLHWATRDVHELVINWLGGVRAIERKMEPSSPMPGS